MEYNTLKTKEVNLLLHTSTLYVSALVSLYTPLVKLPAVQDGAQLLMGKQLMLQPNPAGKGSTNFQEG